MSEEERNLKPSPNDEPQDGATEPRDPASLEFTEPPRSEDDTDEVDFGDDDIPFKLPRAAASENIQPTLDVREDPHRMVTMPVFRDPKMSDPRVTLPGSGGLDPNPDMPAPQRPNIERTVQHIPAAPAPAPSPQEQYTAANPSLSDSRYQRPAGGYAPPPPPQQQGNGQKKLAPRRPAPRRILGFRPGCLWMFAGLILTFCGGLTLLTGGAAAIFIPRIEEEWNARLEGVDDYRAFQSTFIYDRAGRELFEAFGEGRRQTVTYDRFPRDLINATVAIEDGSFWTNVGVDIPATIVAFTRFLGAEAGERTPGGSTITQQLVRNILFDYEARTSVSVQRKAEEIVLAFLLTQRRSKQDILEMYLNEIYYGNLAYGAQAAAQTFFGKDVQNLTLGEAALLAGLPQAPANLDPLNPDPAVQNAVYARWRQVLNEMIDEGYINAAQRDAALSAGLTFAPQATSLRAPHFTVYAQREFERLMTSLGYSPEEIARGGFRIYTTIDQDINNLALGAARTQVAALANNNVTNGAVVVLKPLTGEIIAMVGSIDYNSQVIDGRVNVTISLRQPGSTMKPFTYSAALERGMTPATVLWDTRTDIGIPGGQMYSPVNYDRAFHGPMTMRSALANSYNIPAVQTLRLVGVDYLLELLRRFGVTTLGTDASRYGLSLTLGGGEVSLLELTAGYAVFANQGAYVQPTSILCVMNSQNEILYQYENGCPSQANGRMTPRTVDRLGLGRQVLDPRVAFLMTDIMSDNAARSPAMGARSPLRTDGIDTAVKTGTTDDVKDNWTVGYTRNVAIGVWVGNNDGQPMRNTSGLAGAAPIWNSVMTSIYTTSGALNAFAVGGQLQQDKPPAPVGMTLRQICDVARITDPSTGCPAQRAEWMLDGPVGIPDAQGNLQYPSVNLLTSQNDPTMQEISPGVYSALVFPIPEPVAAGIQFQLQPGDKPPLPPRYCRVTASLAANAPGAQQLVFIQGPVTSQGDYVEAERYARDRGLAVLPTIECWPDVFNYTQQVETQPGVVTTIISSPANGQVVSGVIPIQGTAWFDQWTAEFYHLFIQGGPFADWTPLGTAHYNAVVNGQLDTLHADALPSGTYRLQLRIFKAWQPVGSPYEVTFVKP